MGELRSVGGRLDKCPGRVLYHQPPLGNIGVAGIRGGFGGYKVGGTER